MMVWGLILRPSPIFSHRSAAGSPLRKGWEESGNWELNKKVKGLQ